MRELAYAEKLALKMFGGIPAGNICGIPILIDPRLPDNRIKIVYHDGREHDLPFALTDPAPRQGSQG